MLSAAQKGKYSQRVKNEVKKLLHELNISQINDDTIRILQEQLDVKVSGLVTLKECDNAVIDEELLDVYDLLIDIIIDNEEDPEFLNALFFD